VYGELMAQSHLKPLYDQIAYTWDEASQTLVGDLTAGNDRALIAANNEIWKETA